MGKLVDLAREGVAICDQLILAIEGDARRMRVWTKREATDAGGVWLICVDKKAVATIRDWPGTADADFIVDACNAAEQRQVSEAAVFARRNYCCEPCEEREERKVPEQLERDRAVIERMPHNVDSA